MTPSALIVGLDPALLDAPGVDRSDGVTSGRVRQNMHQAVADLAAAGIDAELFLLAGTTASVIDDLRAAVERRVPDSVMIGAGVRLEPSSSWFLELMIDAVLSVAPRTRLCFNEDPESMAVAVRRVISLPERTIR